MKKLLQHKSFIYHGKSLNSIMKSIAKDLSELLEICEDDVFHKEDVSLYECDQLLAEHWDDVRNNFLFAPTKGYKVIVFSNADKLSLLIQNKLLMPIEEASERTKIIFCTTKPLIDTIKSRSVMVNVRDNNQLVFPKSEKELMDFFSVSESQLNIVRMPLIGLYKGVKENGSLIKCTGLIREKSKALAFFSEKVQEIAKLIILFEIESGRITGRSKIVSQYLEREPSEGDLYLMLLELESQRGEL